MSGSGYSGSRPRPAPPGPRPSPVRITTPDGDSHVVSAHEFKTRAMPETEEAAPAEEMTPAGAVTTESLEDMTRRTLYRVMKDSEKLSERTAAATAAVKYLSIKYRVGPELGADLDEP